MLFYIVKNFVFERTWERERSVGEEEEKGFPAFVRRLQVEPRNGLVL